MRREGSPWRGLGVVIMKELGDHVRSVRMIVLGLLVVLIAGAVVYGAVEQAREATAENQFLYLLLFTTERGQVPALLSFLAILVPLIAIGLGFDAVNGEHNRRTLSRILAQPIYRDALLFGKFLAGVFVLSITLIALWLMMIGWGLQRFGVPPNSEEMARAFLFLLVTIAYAGVWLALALLFSILFRSAASAALLTLGLWLFLTMIWPILATMIAVSIAPPDPRFLQMGLPSPGTLEWTQMLMRLSPSALYGEVAQVLLNPGIRGFGLLAQLLPLYGGAVPGAPLPLLESLMIAWPQIVGLVAGSILLFVAGYIIFQRQEVRA
jgi:ABC-2 type transport system permease protein